MIEHEVKSLLHCVRPLDERPVDVVPATEEELWRFEQTHQIRFDQELRSWLRYCNGANVNPGGIESLFPKNDFLCMDWHFKQYPVWKERGWFPLASDGCGDLFIMAAQTIIPSTGTHPVCFLEQSDFENPRYAVASGVWKFFHVFLKSEVLREQGRESLWPFDKRAVLIDDPALGECIDFPLPWEIDEE